ncbi:hypothetical protein [Granulicella tundricola]|nr:hypothetical protein [Granulicella tundricola]
MTVVVLVGFFLMLLAPCVIAIVGGREKKEKIAATPVVPVAAAFDEDLDLPVRVPGDMSHLTPVAPYVAETEMAVAPVRRPAMGYQESVPYGAPQRVPRRDRDLKSIVAEAESEAMVAHAMAAQANAAAMAATARAAQARAQAAAEHAVAANKAAMNHAAAAREREERDELDEFLSVEPTWPELTVAVSSDGKSQRAA